MPLIQWIMQNLQPVQKNQGVVVGGSAFISQESFIAEPVKVIVNVTTVVRTAHINRKPIKFNIGDTVFDSCNKSYVVIGFEFNTINEPVYIVSNNGFVKKIRESDLYYLKDILDRLTSLAVEGTECANEPLVNLPVYPGRRRREE